MKLQLKARVPSRTRIPIGTIVEGEFAVFQGAHILAYQTELCDEVITMYPHEVSELSDEAFRSATEGPSATHILNTMGPQTWWLPKPHYFLLLGVPEGRGRIFACAADGL